jgi:predicted molibdopterin-dependent oxidoreductase YjgC
MVRKDGVLVETSWEQALAAAAQGLQSAGADLFALVSARPTNEEIWQAQRLLDALGTKHRDVKPRAFKKDALLRTGDGNPNTAGAKILGLEAKRGAGDHSKCTAAFLVGEDVDDIPDALASLEKLSFVVAIATHENETTRRAHVVLPGLTPYEKDGSFVNVTGRVQKILPAVKAPGDAWPDWKILGALRNVVSKEPRPKSAGEVFAQMAASVPQFAGMTHGKLGLHGLDVRVAQGATG